VSGHLRRRCDDGVRRKVFKYIFKDVTRDVSI
jgi:hypothetical protein